MTNIKLIVNGAKARAEVDGILTSSSIGIPVAIQYDSTWDGLTKNLVCTSGKWGPTGKPRTILNIETSAAVAHEVMIADNHLYIGVEGRRADGALVICTVWADCGPIFPGATANADPSVKPTMPVWAQLQRQIDDLKITVTENNSVQNTNGMSNSEKLLLLSLLKRAAYTTDMSANFVQLESLWSDANNGSTDDGNDGGESKITLSSISATYNGGDVTVGTVVADLTGIVVTATYSDGSTRTVNDYTLSGTIAEGENTITVSYGGMTTTFAVTGVAESSGGDEPATTLFASSAAIATDGNTSVWSYGYINDSGETEALENAYFYDSHIQAQGFVLLDSSDAVVNTNLRIAEYDDNKQFLSRKLAEKTTAVIGDNSPSYIKCGFSSNTAYRSAIHKILPLIPVADLCTVENVTIDTTGATVTFEGRNATEYIPITDGVGNFYVKAVGVSAIVAFYDSDYALVDRIAFGGGGEQLISVPDNAAYIRICVAGDSVYTSLKFTVE